MEVSVASMNLDYATQAAALIGVLGTAVVYGTDVFCAMVLRPALAKVDDAALVAVMGNVHRYGDSRMPAPGVVGVVASAAAVALAVVDAQWFRVAASGVALLLLVVWLVVYARVSAPINRQLTAAADEGRTLPNGRALQAKWDRVIVARATLQGVAVAALCVVLAV